MATVSYTIYSHYDPHESETLEQESDLPVDGTQASTDTWQSEASLASRRRLAPAPQFVPGTILFNEWGSETAASSSQTAEVQDHSLGNDLARWYRSLRSNPEHDGKKTDPNIRSSGFGGEEVSQQGGILEGRNKNNWFIMRAIQAEQTTPRTVPAPSLAGIIARNPPPLPTEGRYSPPVWLEIGPSNKGFAMLQRNGWNEGEPLGPNVIRRGVSTADYETTSFNGKRRKDTVKRETLEVKFGQYEGVNELRKVDIIDLTLSDSDSDDDDASTTVAERAGLAPESTVAQNLPLFESSRPPPPTHGGTALLTPIATVLKFDRLGIGLKAKTVGPYKASQKRVTHNAAAMAAHMSAAEEGRQQKKKLGHGRRRYQRQHKQVEAARKSLLAYLNE